MLLKDRLFNVLLSLLYAVTVYSLASLGEQRLDAYFSMLVLEYFVLYALLRPKRRHRDYIALVLIALFSVVVAFRVLEVIGR
jgi:predicted neutral ceramidase superfamily lipid hydrolase